MSNQARSPQKHGSFYFLVAPFFKGEIRRSDFHEHAPFAIKALKAGKHVMSECTCNATLAEGVALCRAVEETGRIYMLAENYAYTAFSMEMRRLYRTGEIGEVTYAEGEYNHPMAMRDGH